MRLWYTSRQQATGVGIRTGDENMVLQTLLWGLLELCIKCVLVANMAKKTQTNKSTKHQPLYTVLSH